jgi:RluA family pseudouridine synthase
MKAQFVNIAAYKFVALDNLPQRKQKYLEFCNAHDLKGTILLSLEGINMFLSGTRENIDYLVGFLRDLPEFADIPIKESPSDHQPHSRMLVRLKKEIISMGVETIQPEEKTSPKIKAETLKQWLDEGREVALLDTRNDYEIDLGTFENAIPIGVDSFREFPAAVDTLPSDLKSKPIVMFCTGGIRCEKAGPLMEEKGFQEVYQLDGGILKYFEDCGGDHYDGDCFVFDKRVAVDPGLQETDAEQCFACQAILSMDEQKSPKYQPPSSCPHCYLTPAEHMVRVLEKRNHSIADFTSPLPGSIPYNNVRPINVPLKFDHAPLIEVLTGMYPHLEREHWLKKIADKHLVWKSEPLNAEDEVRSGWRLEHLIPQTIEPDVNADLRIVFEDDSIIGVAKPAPLPMHPCGRFNRNSLTYLINEIYQGEQIRISHRLDANTSGIVVCCRKKSASRRVQPQFENSTVKKTYLAEVNGTPKLDRFDCDAAISAEPGSAGSRVVDPNGLSAQTQFEVIQRNGSTTLLKCTPHTGRTNQIRIHLWHLGLPIVGDPLYLRDGQLGQSQTLPVDAEPMRLHALEIQLNHPVTNEPLVLNAGNPCWLA